MASFEVQFKTSVEKDLKSIPRKSIQSIMDKIVQLSSNPYPAGTVKLEGADKTFRIRVGKYRIIYEVDTEKRLVLINYIRHRSEAYKKR